MIWFILGFGSRGRPDRTRHRRRFCRGNRSVFETLGQVLGFSTWAQTKKRSCGFNKTTPSIISLSFAVISKQERGHGYGIRIRVSVLESPPSEVCSRISLRRCWKHRKGTARQTDEKRELRSIVDEEGRGVFCSIVGCGARLICSEEFEEHYNARQTASCSVCSRVYPASRLLGIHVSEAHSFFFQAKVAHGDPMYECLVEGCDLTLKSYKSRQQHLVDKHKFPTSFEFFKKAPPYKKRRQKNQRKQAYVMKEDASDMDVENEVTDVTDPTRKQKRKNQRKQANLKKLNASNMDVGNEDINNLVSSVSKLSTSDSSPSSISFGRRHTRGLTFVPRAVQREKKPNST